MSSPSMSRVAAIDCGTNSIRLLIADKVDGGLQDVHREMRIVRLGQGINATGNSRQTRSRARRRRWSTTPSCCAVSRCPR